MHFDEKNVARALEILDRHKTADKILKDLAYPGDEILSEGAQSHEMELAFWTTFVDVMLSPFNDKENRIRAIARYAKFIEATLHSELERMKA